MDGSFGHFISGLTTGEGCFEFRVSKENKFRPRFSIKLRDDDYAVLFEIAEALGCGDIYPMPYKDISGREPQRKLLGDRIGNMMFHGPRKNINKFLRLVGRLPE